ncbi:hypothetical protein [Pedobacter sp. SYP-B3415]|uniref:hypothetical protein n=1 Tax=Pedobacter sp. SYP-B3415 TaxID=2496641 RepID=UPI00101BFBEF|nr:hypothetical protein [Pedobacter sp. SYP-B3415]
MHDGETVELVIRRDQISISELSRRLHVSRKSIYNWFKQKQLNVELIHRIGQSISYDFANDFPEKYNGFHAARSAEEGPGIKGHADSTSNSPQYWRDKYIRLLETYTSFLSQHNPLVNDEH